MGADGSRHRAACGEVAALRRLLSLALVLAAGGLGPPVALAQPAGELRVALPGAPWSRTRRGSL